MYYEEEERVRHYECPECGRKFTSPAELKIYTFTDGEKRKQCIYRNDCPFHPDEKMEFQRDIDEFDYTDPITDYENNRF